MKKILAFVLAIAMIASVAILAGCDKKDDSASKTEETKADTNIDRSGFAHGDQRLLPALRDVRR